MLRMTKERVSKRKDNNLVRLSDVVYAELKKRATEDQRSAANYLELTLRRLWQIQN